MSVRRRCHHHRRRSDALFLPRSLPRNLHPSPLRSCRLPRERGERRWSSSSNYFSLASKHFNATSTNELVLFSLPRNPPLEQNRVTSSPPFLSFCVGRVLRAPSPSRVLLSLSLPVRFQPGPPLNADRKFPHYFNCARTAIIHPRAKKIIKCL